MVAAGVASIILSVVSISGFANPAGGDSIAMPLSGLTLATLLVGALTLLGLEMAHAASRWARLATVARAAGEPWAGPLRKTRSSIDAPGRPGVR